MQGFMRHRSRRWGYDGWAVRVRGGEQPLAHTVSTTREEARAELAQQMKFGNSLEVVKVRIAIEVVQ
jgi:hypothetical protein